MSAGGCVTEPWASRISASVSHAACRIAPASSERETRRPTRSITASSWFWRVSVRSCARALVTSRTTQMRPNGRPWASRIGRVCSSVRRLGIAHAATCACRELGIGEALLDPLADALGLDQARLDRGHALVHGAAREPVGGLADEARQDLVDVVDAPAAVPQRRHREAVRAGVERRLEAGRALGDLGAALLEADERERERARERADLVVARGRGREVLGHEVGAAGHGGEVGERQRHDEQQEPPQEEPERERARRGRGCGS